MTTGLDKLTALMAQLAQSQDDDCREWDRWEEERRQQDEEYRREQDEYRREQEEHCQKKEEYRREQDERHQEQLTTMQEQHRQQLEALRERRLTTDSLLRMTTFQKNEDIQDFLEAFEGIMGIQNIDKDEWVLRLPHYSRQRLEASVQIFGTQWNMME